MAGNVVTPPMEHAAAPKFQTTKLRIIAMVPVISIFWLLRTLSVAIIPLVLLPVCRSIPPHAMEPSAIQFRSSVYR